MPLPFPVIYLLPTRLTADELRSLEAQIPSITHNVHEAEVVLGNISRKERAMFELRRLGLTAAEEVMSDVVTQASRKRRRVSEDPPAAADDDEVQFLGSRPLSTAAQSSVRTGPSSNALAAQTNGDSARRLSVVKLAWFTDSSCRGEILPFDDYLLYQGIKPEGISNFNGAHSPVLELSAVLQRSQSDAVGSARQQGRARQLSRSSSWNAPPTAAHHLPKRPALVHQTTSEHDAVEAMPPVPDFLHTVYSCQRPTPIYPPNEAFIEELGKIRTSRLLTGDKVGVRAYSSAMASLAAYPYALTAAEEVDRLPGCGPKIALLFQEFKRQGGVVKEAQNAESNPKLAVLREFYNVWGVGEATAREWYDKGWRDLDDVVEHGWETLTRVQQIGVKFYDEFLLKIPRSEVESIADTVLEHANQIQSGFQMVIVGGHRRGKKESGDVDVVLSHPDETATVNFVTALVIALEDSHHITHTLSLSVKNSERGQVPLHWRGEVDKAPGTGFDTLDKALVVWQDPRWPSGGDDGEAQGKNPNPHRRVDIIVSPWKTAGCAVLSWTSGTTFQRDLRHYCKRELGLKFDSSGIRSRKDGRWVDLESGEDGRPAPDMLTAEKRVFAGLKLEWRPPEERSTG